jgi:adenylosuccinate synthase
VIGRTAGVLGVLRTYQTRHGAGPLAGEDDDLLRRRPERHNDTGVYQGQWRVGPLDPVAVRYAVEVSHGVDGLALTHLDRTTGADYVSGYRYGGHLVDRLPGGSSLDHQQRLAKVVAGSEVTLAALPDEPAAVVDAVSRVIGAPVLLTADGPDRKNRSASTR